MKRILTEKTLRNIIKKSISEALRYDKDAKRYFPKYTGDPHSDAGKFVNNNRGDWEYSHNDYKWSDPEKQKRFERLQYRNDFEPDYEDSDKEHEDDAMNYLVSRNPDTIIDTAAEELRGNFENLIQQFLAQASEKYPVLKDRYYMTDFIYRLKDILDEYDY